MPTERMVEANELMIDRFQPKQMHRFIMYIDGIPSWVIKTAQRPQPQTNVIPIDYINMQRKFAGKWTWNSISITLIDPVVPSAAQAIMEWLRLHHESLTGRDGYQDFYKKDLDLYGLGPVGDLVEKWKLYGAFLETVDFGGYDYTSDSPIEINVTLNYDWAILEF